MNKEKLSTLIDKAQKKNKIYSPVVIGDKIYYQLKQRNLEDNIEKMKLFPDLNDESVVEIGSNSGFNVFYLKKNKNAGMSLGLDNDENLIAISEILNEVYGYKDVVFSYFDVNSKLFMDQLPDFDNFLFLSIVSAQPNKLRIDFHKVLTEINKKAKKRIFVEPTNHEKLSPREYIDFYMDYLGEFGDVKYLGNTIYQNRGLFQITKK